jgi:hypothetical protein|tara:strand:- start:583 stop:1314 length:732 start_codon:yes stop_codon:yes gene_type:complete
MIHYIVACYLGNRRANNSINTKFVNNHLKFLKTSKEINKATFVFNKSNHIDEDKIVNKVKTLGYNVLVRENKGFSYGAWEEVLSMDDNLSKYKYSFLIEDDYNPVHPNFISYFIKKVQKDTIFVASKIAIDPKKFEIGGNRAYVHAAVSNGLLVNKHIDVEEIFSIEREDIPNSYGNLGAPNQRNFLSKYTDFINELKMVDITDIAHTLFFKIEHPIGDRILTFGNPDLPLLIEPNCINEYEL